MKEAKKTSTGRYIFSQALRLYKAQRLHVFLLFFCYTVSFFLPAITQAYRDTLLDSFTLQSDFMLSCEISGREQRERIMTGDSLRELMQEMNIPEEATVNIIVGGTTVTKVFEGEPVYGYFCWTLANDSKGRIHGIWPEEDILFGTPLTGERSCLVGEHLIPGVRAKDLPGSQIELNGIPYTIAGVVPKYQGILATINEDVFFSFASLYFMVPQADQKTSSAYADKLEEQGFIVEMIRVPEKERTATQSYVIQSTDFYVVFAFLCYVFCFASTVSIISAAMYDNKHRIFVKLSIGAALSKIVAEYFLFFLGIAVAASCVAAGLIALTGPYFLNFGFRPLAISWQTSALLVGFGMLTSLAASCYAAFWMARKVA